MRLISQDGMIDVPYDKIVVKVTEHPFEMVISALFEREDCMKDIVMGYYSTESKALKVMEMLRSTYVNNEYYKSLCNGVAIPLPNNSDDMKEKMIATHTFRATTIFQFPKDEEVEVQEWQDLKR